MITLSLLCTAIMLVAFAVLVEQSRRERVESALALLDHEMDISRGVSARDVRHALQRSGAWALSFDAIDAAFSARFSGKKPKQSRRRRQRIIAHILGRCGNGCTCCKHTHVWTVSARNAGLFEKYERMATL